MGKVIEIDDALWARLSVVARRERKTPRGFVRALIQESLEADLDRKLDAAIAKEARRSGYREEDAVELVREYRLQAHRVREQPAPKGGSREEPGERPKAPKSGSCRK